MACMAPNSPRFQLERPPVRRVTLTVNFETAPRLQGWHLGTFFRNLETRYLSREEVPPHLAPDSADYELERPVIAWPIPRTEFAGVDRSLSVQGDELEVAWTFGGDDEDHEYPGFESLMAELGGVFADLVSSASEHAVTITPQRVGCFYVNEIDGISAADLAVGVLTGWRGGSSRPMPSQGYVGVRLHGCRVPEEHDCSSLVMVDSVDDGAPRLSIDVVRPLGEDGLVEPALRAAHDELIDLFKLHTSDQLRTEWGES